MAKNKSKKLFEKVQFNDYAAAQSVADKAKRRNLFGWIGMALSVYATYLAFSGFSNGNEGSMILAGVLAIPSYLLLGGIGSALKLAWNLGWFGWLILPFPFDIVTGVFTFFYAGLGFFLCPAFFTFLRFIQINKEYHAAKEYLSFYTPA